MDLRPFLDSVGRDRLMPKIKYKDFNFRPATLAMRN